MVSSNAWSSDDLLSSGPPAVKALHSISFETPDGRFRSHHLSLRVSQIGDHWVQTLKVETGPRSGDHHLTNLGTSLN
jgi:inorganic triphosphatase YgiF